MKYFPENSADFEKQRKKFRIRGWLQISLTIAFVILLFLSSSSYTFSPFVDALFVFYFFWSGFENFKNSRRMPFVEIDSTGVKWQTGITTVQSGEITWDETHWIKSDNEQGVIFFRDCSFSSYLSLTEFSGQQQADIIGAIRENADNRQIRFISVAVA